MTVNWVETLSAKEVDMVRRSIDAAVNGPFFPDWEFHSLFGRSRDEVRRLLQPWPKLDAPESKAVLINVLNNLVGYPISDVAAWSKYVSSPKKEIAAILAKVASIS